ncbi:MAG: hypothetical protein WDZ31_02565 [Phycisphaeraceae bacterium]
MNARNVFGKWNEYTVKLTEAHATFYDAAGGDPKRVFDEARGPMFVMVNVAWVLAGRSRR